MRQRDGAIGKSVYYVCFMIGRLEKYDKEWPEKVSLWNQLIIISFFFNCEW